MKCFKATIKTKYLEFRLVLFAENKIEANITTSEYMLNHEDAQGSVFKIINIEEIEMNKGVISCDVYDNEDILSI